MASLFGLSEVLAPLHTKTNVGLTDVYQTYWMKPDGLDKMHETTPYTDEHQQVQYHHPNEFLVNKKAVFKTSNKSKEDKDQLIGT